MEQTIGIIMCICICSLCLIEMAFLGLSIYKKQKVSIVIHIIGVVATALLAAFLIAYNTGAKIPFESDKMLFATIIVCIVVFIAISIESFFVDQNGIDFRIKAKREKLKEIKEQKKIDEASEPEESSQSDDDQKDVENDKTSDKDQKDNSNDQKSLKEDDNKKSSKDDHHDDDNKKNLDEVEMVKRSQKRKRKNKKKK